MAVTTPSTSTAAARAPARSAPAVSAPPGERASIALLVVLVAATAYAAFAHGAAQLPEETRLQIGLAVVALVTGALWLADGRIRLSAPRAAWWGIGLLAGFAVWSGLTLLWSVAPDRTWEELNRALAYALIVVLGVAVGSSTPRAIERLALGWLGVAVAVALFAVGGKVVPGLHINPLFDLNHAGDVARLRAPLEYWNALALVCVLGVPIAVRLVSDETRRQRERLAAIAALYLLLVVAGLTYSRGGVLAIVTATIAMTLLGGARLRGLAIVLGTVAAAMPGLLYAFDTTGLKANGAPLALRIHDGRIFGVILVGTVAVLVGIAYLLMRQEPRLLASWSPARERRAWRALGVAACVALLIGVIGVAASHRGLRGTVSHTWHSFTKVRQDKQYDPVRLISTNSGNRWVWWKEALGAFSDRPFGGWGAGSFPVTHKLYRTNQIPVQQPHSVELQFLAETGLVGAALALGGIAALLWAALSRVRTVPRGRERDLTVALFAAGVAWLVHGAYDWDWDIPGVTIPALLFLGVLCGMPGRSAPRARPAPFGLPDRTGLGARIAGLAVLSILLFVFIVSAALPAWSQSKASAAEAAAGGNPTPASLQSAAAEADLAARLDPVAVEPLFAAAAIAQRRGRLLDARHYLLQAADRQPYDGEVWFRLAGVAFQLADRPGFRIAAHKVLALDPANGAARGFAMRALIASTPDTESATATGTPLPAAPTVAPTAPAPPTTTTTP